MILARDLDPPLPHLTSSENYQHKRLGSRFTISSTLPLFLRGELFEIRVGASESFHLSYFPIFTSQIVRNQ